MREILAIGGSAGSIPVILAIIEALPPVFDVSVIIILHRSKNVHSEMGKLLVNNRTDMRIREPEDKEAIRKGHVYLAPQNYHLLVEDDKTFSLDYSELIHYSRPSIDVTFESLANVYGSRVTCILLSGASKDGAAGLSKVIDLGGEGIVQDPSTAEYSTMPQAGIDQNKNAKSYRVSDITDLIRGL